MLRHWHFDGQQIVLDAVAPQLIKPILRSLYTGSFFADDQVSHYAVNDLLEPRCAVASWCQMNFLLRRTTLSNFPARTAVLTLEEWLEILARCVSMVPSDPNPLVPSVVKALKRDAAKCVAEGQFHSKQGKPGVQESHPGAFPKQQQGTMQPPAPGVSVAPPGVPSGQGAC